MAKSPIGVFDSGYGGLTILNKLREHLPTYDFLYLGDNARTPYGTRSFEVVYEFTLQAVEFLFAQGCELVILACNTASAKALRNIQQNILPLKYPTKKVLGVIRPTSEIIGNFTTTKQIGIVATEGTVKSNSYKIEVEKFFPELDVHQHSCPIWVPLIENTLHESEGGKWFIKNDIETLLALHPEIDTILLACTHFPLVLEQIQHIVPKNIQILSQADIVAQSLLDYLSRHPAINQKCSKTGKLRFLTTENNTIFDEKATLFFGENLSSEQVKLV